MKDATADRTPHPVDSATGVDTHYTSTPVPMNEDEDDKDIDANLVFSNASVKRSLAQEGASMADPEATGSSHLAASGPVVLATAAAFMEQVAYIQQMVGVTIPMVSGEGNPVGEADPNQLLKDDPDERVPLPGERSWNRSGRLAVTVMCDRSGSQQSEIPVC
jgi:hypothetical protein